MKTSLKMAVILILSTFMVSSHGEVLGRLFFTPEQRKQLDSTEAVSDKPGFYTQSLTVNGIVQKSGGRRTVWINGVSQPAGSSDEKSPESYPLDVPGVDRPVRVKVGQKVAVDSVTEYGK
jgi:hypothetical protein